MLGSAHGLRKTGATLAAENGATEAQLNAIFGWAQGSRESARYTAAARRKVLAEAGARLIFVPSKPAGTKRGESSKENKPPLEGWWAREGSNLQPDGYEPHKSISRYLLPCLKNRPQRLCS